MKEHEKKSFIAEARRKQIIEAAIQILDEIGYVNASLSKIAKKAGISTGLISYHFSDKTELMNHLLMSLVESSTTYILEKVDMKNTASEKLEAFITASLTYQGNHPDRNTALVEIVFNARTPDNVPYYKLNDDDEDPLMDTLFHILRTGQKQSEFGQFNADSMATMIQGAIGEYMMSSTITRKVDLETYCRELIQNINRSVKN